MRIRVRLAAIAAVVIAAAGIGAAAPAQAVVYIGVGAPLTGDSYWGEYGAWISGAVSGYSSGQQLNFCIQGQYQETQSLPEVEPGEQAAAGFRFDTGLSPYVLAHGPGSYTWTMHLVATGAGAVCPSSPTLTGSFTIWGPDVVVRGSAGGLAGAPRPLALQLRGYDPGMELRVEIWNSSNTLVDDWSTVIPHQYEHAGEPDQRYGPYEVERSLDALAAGSYRYRVSLDTPSGQLKNWSSRGEFVISNAALPGRIAGQDRYATSAEIARVWDVYFDRRDSVPSGSSSDSTTSADTSVAFVATGENFPDALSAAAAATYLGAPLLLTRKGSLPGAVKSRLNQLKPDIIYVLGSTSAISNSVVTALRSVSGSPRVERLQGADRYATMRAIVKKVYGVDGNGDAQESVDLPYLVIATGENFPDALSAGPAAASVHGAVVLVDGDEYLPEPTRSLILDLNPQKVVIVGSTAAVGSVIEQQLRDEFEDEYTSGRVIRRAGADRYQTSVRLNDYFFGSSEAVFFAVGTNFPDALSGSTLAGALGVPLIVTPKNCVSSPVKSFVNGQAKPRYKVLLGSSSVLSGSVAGLKVC